MRIDVPVRGMHCAGCVATVEEAARAAPGILSATANLASESLAIEIDPTSFRAADFSRALERQGYGLVPRRKAYRVQNLDPAGAASLEERLSALPGVLDASVDYDASRVSADILFEGDIEDVLRREGLEPRSEDVAVPDREMRNLTLKAAISLALAVALMAHAIPPWAAFALALPVQFWAGWSFHIGCLRALRRGAPDMNTLISLGTNAAFAAGIVSDHSYFETAATIIAVVLLGRTLELRARRGARRAVESLLAMAPRTTVRPGDEIWIKPGERIPADGVILEGASPVDESLVTGESMPVDKTPGDRAIGGTLNTTGTLRIRFDRTGDDTLLAQMARIVRELQGTKTSAQRLADQWARRFVPIVIAIAALTLAAWLWLDRSQALGATLAVLVVACPCAFGLATPAAVVAVSGRAARRGILVKDARALERLAVVNRVVFDKTGTLTVGRLRVAAVAPAPGWTSEQVLELAAAVERNSEHPVARAIAAAVPGTARASDFQARPGFGALGKVEGREIAVGNPAFMRVLGLDVASPEDGTTLALVASDEKLAGSISLEDTPRAEAAGVVGELRRLGLRVSLLTGDRAAAARALAKLLDIADVDAEVMPQDKANRIRLMQESGGLVAMVGDGINDAPALAQADVGIAVARGTDIAAEAADVVLMKSDLGRVAEAIRLGRAARRIIQQNFAWAFGYNAILLPLAAGALRPWGIGLDPMLAAAAMALSSITVVGNSLRLTRAG